MPYGSAAIDTIQSSGNLAITGNVTTTGTFALGSQALGTPFAGEFEYDGRVPYFTPLDAQRGVVPGMQYYRLNSSLAGSNVNTAQSFFGVGASLSSNTVYAFEMQVAIVKTTGSTSHVVQTLFGGTATINNILYDCRAIFYNGSLNGQMGSSNLNSSVVNTTSATSITSASAVTTLVFSASIKGTVSVNVGGTFIPQYQLTAAPGGAYTTQIGSYVLIYPIGADGSNTSVGTWA